MERTYLDMSCCYNLNNPSIFQAYTIQKQLDFFFSPVRNVKRQSLYNHNPNDGLLTYDGKRLPIVEHHKLYRIIVHCAYEFYMYA